MPCRDMERIECPCGTPKIILSQQREDSSTERVLLQKGSSASHEKKGAVAISGSEDASLIELTCTQERGGGETERGVAYVATRQANGLAAPAFPCTGRPVPLSLRSAASIQGWAGSLAKMKQQPALLQTAGNYPRVVSLDKLSLLLLRESVPRLATGRQHCDADSNEEEKIGSSAEKPGEGVAHSRHVWRICFVMAFAGSSDVLA